MNTITFLKKMLDTPCVVGVVADVNTGKSMLIYDLLHRLRQHKVFTLYHYGLKCDVGGVKINSVEEIETVENSLIIIDELSSFFKVEDRKHKHLIEQSLRLINHKNNILILCGTPENFKKFLSAKLDLIIFKKTSIADCINGSKVKKVLSNYQGIEKGSSVLNIALNNALVFDGLHYTLVDVAYRDQYDTKISNVPIFERRNVQLKK